MLDAGVDLRQLKRFSPELREAARQGLRAATKLGVEIVRQEVPEDSERLKKSVASKIIEQAWRGEISVEAVRPAQGPMTGTIHLPSGRTKQIRLGATPAIDYVGFILGGTGIYGPRGTVIRSKGGGPLRIPVEQVSPGDTYVEAGGKRYVYRMYVRGMKPNPFDERSAKRLEREAPAVVEEALEALK